MLALVAVMVIALLPTGGRPEWFAQADKVRHAGAFVTLWWLGSRVRLFPVWGLGLILLGFGISIEVAQSFTTYREASVMDVVADLAGILLGACLWRPGLVVSSPAT